MSDPDRKKGIWISFDGIKMMLIRLTYYSALCSEFSRAHTLNVSAYQRRHSSASSFFSSGSAQKRVGSRAQMGELRDVLESVGTPRRSPRFLSHLQ